MEYIIRDKMRQWGLANNYDVELHLEFFNDYLANKPGKPYKDNDAAFRNCVRADWGNMRRNQKGKQNGYVDAKTADRKRAIRELTGYDADAIQGVSVRYG